MKGMFAQVLMLTVLLFVAGFCWLIFSPIFEDGIFPMYDDWAATSTSNHTRSDATAEYVKSSWYNWPIVLVICIVLGMIFVASRAGSDGGQYYG